MKGIDNNVLLVILMVVLITFVVLLVALGIVFIVALRKRAPVVKVVMSAQPTREEPEEAEESSVSEDAAGEGATGDNVPPPEPEDDDDDDEAPTFVTEGQERVSYNRSMMAKVSQLPNEVKEWYSELKNELLSYETVKLRTSWKRETYRIGRNTVARIVVRGKTLCLLLAVEPDGYNGTKYTVEDVSNVSSTLDTPTLYRIKSVRRLKYAKEMIAGIMKELRLFKDPRYEPKDYFLPYEGDMALMQKGLVKRVVSGSTRTFRIEEVEREAEAAATTEQTETKPEEPKAATPKPKTPPKSKPAQKPKTEEETEPAEAKPKTKSKAKSAPKPTEEVKPEEESKPAETETPAENTEA
ncbi:MAG: hypothetical protein J1F39_00880 [Clostridiales bacterium]|nr:hypothetical protein [Clostridiales bacterium]